MMPAYNEAKYVGSVLKKLNQITDNVIVVDDASTDKTAAIAAKYTENLIVQDKNYGKGAAMLVGAEHAFRKLKAEAVVFIDSDGQHDPAELPLFFKKIQDGAEIVFGVREFGREMPLVRIVGNRLASFAILVLFGQYIPDIPSGYKALTKKAFNIVKWHAAEYSVEMEIAARCASAKLPFEIVSIKTIYHDMDRGMRAMDVLKAVFDAILLKIASLNENK